MALMGCFVMQASALADEQYAAYIAPLEPQIQAAYEVVSPHVDQAYQATQRVYQESIHPVVADGYDKAARFYSGNLGPHVDEAWRQAQPHIDTASQFYEGVPQRPAGTSVVLGF